MPNWLVSKIVPRYCTVWAITGHPLLHFLLTSDRHRRPLYAKIIGLPSANSFGIIGAGTRWGGLNERSPQADHRVWRGSAHGAIPLFGTTARNGSPDRPADCRDAYRSVQPDRGTARRPARVELCRGQKHFH